MTARCAICNKKIAIIFLKVNECKCGKLLCSRHKSEASHACTFDWKKYGASQLAQKLIIESSKKSKGLQRL